MKYLHWLNNLSGSNFKRFNLLLGAAGLLLYAVLIAFYQTDRWLYTDSAYTLFRILNLEPLFYDRYANIIQTGPAQWMAQAGFSASTVLTVLNFSLWSICTILYLLVRNKTTNAWLIPMVLISQSALVFFIGYNELILSISGFALLCLDWMNNNRFSRLVQILAAVIMLFAHPAGVVFLPFIFLLYLHREQPISLIVLLPAAILAILKWILIPSNTYDAEIWHRFSINHFWHNISSSYFLFYLREHAFYLVPFLLWLFVIALLLLKSQFKNAIFCLTAVLIVFTVSSLAFSAGDASQVMEKYLQIFTISGIASVFFLPKEISNSISTLIIGVYLCLFTVATVFAGSSWRNHTATVKRAEAFYAVKKHQKILIQQQSLEDYPFSVWALPYESMLISALHGRHETVNIKPVEKENWSDLNNLFKDSTFANAPFLPPLPVKNLNSRYFRLPVAPYFADSSENLPWLKMK